MLRIEEDIQTLWYVDQKLKEISPYPDSPLRDSIIMRLSSLLDGPVVAPLSYNAGLPYDDDSDPYLIGLEDLKVPPYLFEEMEPWDVGIYVPPSRVNASEDSLKDRLLQYLRTIRKE